jgi:protein SCO1/2
MRARLVVFLLLSVLLAACGRHSGDEYRAMDITGIDYGRDFHLTDHNGKPRSLADFKGKVVVVFFGYTHCPEICPTTLSDLSLALKRLGKDAQDVQVLFVTIDPERDTPQLLAQYVPAFNPTFLGLYVDAAATARTAAEFHVTYGKHPSGNSGNYDMDHTAGAFVFDRNGDLRLYTGYGQTAEDYAHDLGLLLKARSAWDWAPSGWGMPF